MTLCDQPHMRCSQSAAADQHKDRLLRDSEYSSNKFRGERNLRHASWIQESQSVWPDALISIYYFGLLERRAETSPIFVTKMRLPLAKVHRRGLHRGIDDWRKQSPRKSSEGSLCIFAVDGVLSQNCRGDRPNESIAGTSTWCVCDVCMA